MDIERWRNEIDEIDEELLRLLNMRARLAIKVGSLKRASGIPVRDREREVRGQVREVLPGRDVRGARQQPREPAALGRDPVRRRE